MSIIADNLYKLSNVAKNIKFKLNNIDNQQLEVIVDIINTCYKRAVENDVVKNTKLLELFNKINARYNVTVVDGQIVLPEINPVVNFSCYSKIYSSYIEMIVSYLRKAINNAQQYTDIFDLINDQKISDLTNTTSIFTQSNDLNTAEETQVLIEKSALNNIILSDLNQIDFADGEEQTLQAIRAKLATGNKHEQIKDSDVSTLVDVDDIKQILKNNENDFFNKTNQSSAH